MSKFTVGVDTVEIKSAFAIELDEDEMNDLVKQWTDGHCPVCLFDEINEGEILCDACFEQAQAYRRNGPPVSRPSYDDPKYHTERGKNKLFKS